MEDARHDNIFVNVELYHFTADIGNLSRFRLHVQYNIRYACKLVKGNHTKMHVIYIN